MQAVRDAIVTALPDLFRLLVSEDDEDTVRVPREERDRFAQKTADADKAIT